VHASAAWLMDRLQGEGANPLPGMTLRHAATVPGQAFGEMMLQQEAPARVLTTLQANTTTNVSSRSEVPAEFAEETTSDRKSAAADQPNETPGQSSVLRAPQTEAQPKPELARTNESGFRPLETESAALPALAPIAGKIATAPAVKATQNAAKQLATHSAKTERVPGPASSASAAPQETATRVASLSVAVSAADPKTEPSAAGDADALRPTIAAPAQGLQFSVQSPNAHLAAKANRVSLQGSPASSPAPSTTATALTTTRNDRSAAAPNSGAKSDSADPAPMSTAGSASAHTSRMVQCFPIEAPRAATRTVASSANATGKPVTAIAQPTLTETSGIANLLSPLARTLSADPVGSAPRSSNDAPATVSAAFTRMDSAAPPQVIESAPQQLSVGVRDRGLGWMEIRTHAAAGQVSVVLATGSSEAHAALQAHLPELRDYLTGQEVHVDQLASERFSSSGGSREPAEQEQGRRAPSGTADSPREGPPMMAAFSEGAEESLSYINVRV
jgi:hypothetical protein